MAMEAKVKDLYTKYPYPQYEEEWDAFAPRYPTRLIPGSSLEQLTHYLYRGEKNFNNYRVLCAGIGLGTELISIGYFLKGFEGTELVGIDLSTTSLNISKKRTAKYQLSNITFIEMSLLDLDKDTHGLFDLIICSGVLHHLNNPTDGLNVLKSVLKDDGGMQIMVYGKIGRTGAYQMQDLLKLINASEDNYEKKIESFKKLYASLPAHNWFRHLEDVLEDHKVSDNGIVDMLLHCQDRAYTVKELYEWIEGSNLNIVDFTLDDRYKYKYDNPCSADVSDKVAKYSINELYFGDIHKHFFYVSKSQNTIAQLDDLDNIMILWGISNDKVLQIISYYEKDPQSHLVVEHQYNLSVGYKETTTSLYYGHYKIRFPINKVISYILKNIDGKTTTKNIFSNLRKDLDVRYTDKTLLKILRPTYDVFNLHDLILLKSE